MNQLTKAKITISILACFSLGWAMIQNGLAIFPLFEAVGFIALQLVAIVIITFVVLSMLEWVRVFDLKTNAILTFLTVVTLRLAFSMAI